MIKIEHASCTIAALDSILQNILILGFCDLLEYKI